ncbi:MAG: hypothetical protein L6Q71_01250 [Planctomycetes bacterium]|nr:hypothetical protein [Planctomycetota bacterium]
MSIANSIFEIAELLMNRQCRIMERRIVYHGFDLLVEHCTLSVKFFQRGNQSALTVANGSFGASNLVRQVSQIVVDLIKPVLKFPQGRASFLHSVQGLDSPSEIIDRGFRLVVEGFDHFRQIVDRGFGLIDEIERHCG